jgi:SSS family solute:Na+ symporter
VEHLATNLDYGIILGYFVLIVLFGSFFGKYIKSTKDFFFAGQKLSWWLISMSCVATTVGSYSFIKYSEAAYEYGFSSTMSYLNDWFWMPLWMFGWLPIIYFTRTASVPEYLEKRFNPTARAFATFILLLYLIGYIGINIYTLGVAAHSLFPSMDVMTASILIGVLSAVYVTFGGQTAVIMTDLVQGILLLVAGFALFFLGLVFLSPYGGLLQNLAPSLRQAFCDFNSPGSFNAVGIFWQDGMANTAAFYFMNQGLILRFLSAKSIYEGRKAFIILVLILMPLAAIAVSNVGWIGRAMVNVGVIAPDTNPKNIFVVVSNLLCVPGVFGFVIAALTAALMSTVDTLINAVSVIAINDIYRPYIKKGASDRHYLAIARAVSIISAIIGIALVPVYAGFKTIYAAHGAFTAAITPPLLVTILLGAFWKRYNAPGALATMLGGAGMIFLSIIFPALIKPFAHGVPADGGYIYMRALFGLLASSTIGIFITLLTKPPAESQLSGLVYSTVKDAIFRFKGSVPNELPGKKVRVKVKYTDRTEADLNLVQLSAAAMQQLNARPGDLLHVSDPAWWYGGLRSAGVVAGAVHPDEQVIYISKKLMTEQNLHLKHDLIVEKIM